MAAGAEQVARLISSFWSATQMVRRIAIGGVGNRSDDPGFPRPGNPSVAARVVIAAFGWAVVLWLLGNVKDLHVAIGAAVVAFVATGLPFGTSLRAAFNGTTLTIVAAFVIAAAVRRVKLTEYAIGRLMSAANGVERHQSCCRCDNGVGAGYSGNFGASRDNAPGGGVDG